jgi:hypothetical protein
MARDMRDSRERRDRWDEAEIQAIPTSPCLGLARRAFLARPANLAG